MSDPVDGRFRLVETRDGGRSWAAVDPARLFTSTDHGHTWTVADTPVAGGPSAGIFSVTFRDARRGVLLGRVDHRRPVLVDVRHRQPRLGRVHERRRLLGVR